MKFDDRSILFLCTEDWFFKSHFLPLADVSQSIENCRSSILCSVGDVRTNLEIRGLDVLPVEFSRRSKNPISAIRLIRQLIKGFRKTRPDVIHMIAMKPILLGGLISWFYPKSGKIYHVTGLGTIAEGNSAFARTLRYFLFGLIVRFLKQPNSHLIVENPDDLEFLRKFGSVSSANVTLLGGAGVDPDYWNIIPLPNCSPPSIAFVGRMIWTKGVDILIESIKLLNKEGCPIQLNLYGEPDKGNPNEISKELLKKWSKIPGVSWKGRSNDVKSVWQKADICVVSTRTREGMPRSMLEAAACGRPLVVTDVPGCRHFVRDGIEGYVVPPENAAELAQALKKLATDRKLRQQMGDAARARVLDGFTEADIRKKVSAIYQQILTSR